MVREMRAVCPDALVLNYTIPMISLTWSVYNAFPAQRVVGLCHNVQYTALALAEYLGVAPERLAYDCAGINHMNWFLRLEVDGQDAYPALRRAAEGPKIFARDRVRFELLLQFGWFVSESSEHTAESTCLRATGTAADAEPAPPPWHASPAVTEGIAKGSILSVPDTTWAM